MKTTTIVLLGFVGGLLPDILRLIKNRQNSSVPVYLKQPMFWVGWLLLALLGGFTAWLLSAQDPKQAVAFGFGAPELLSNLAAKPEAKGAAEETERKEIDRSAPGERTSFDLLRWWQS